MTTPLKPKKLKRGSKKYALRSSKKKKTKQHTTADPENGQTAIMANIEDEELSSIALTNELEKQYEIEQEKTKLTNTHNTSHAVLTIAQFMKPFFKEIQEYQKTINQTYELDSSHFRILKEFQQYIHSLFKAEHDLELILKNLEQIDTLPLEESSEIILDYLKIINKLNKTDSHDILDYFFLKEKLTHLPEITRSVLLEDLINVWEENKEHLADNKTIVEKISTDLIETYNTIKQQETIKNDIASLLNNNEFPEAIKKLSNLSDKIEKNDTKKYLRELHHTLSHFQDGFQHFMETMVNASHHHDVKALNNIYQSYEKYLNINKTLEQHYNEILSSKPPEAVVTLLEQINSTIQKSLFVFEEIITNANVKLAFEKKIESGAIFADEIQKNPEFLKYLSLGMLSDFTPSRAMQMALEGLSSCKDLQDTKNALSFIHFLLLYDSQNVSIDYTKDNNDFIQNIMNNISQRDESIIRLEKDIASFVTEKKESYQKKHTLFLDSLSANTDEKISKQAFSRQLLQSLYHLKNSESTVKNMLCNEFLDYINEAGPNYFSTKNKNFGFPYFAALVFIQEAKNQNLSLPDASLIINNKSKLTDKDNDSTESITVKPMRKFSTLLMGLEKTAEKKLNPHQENILSKNLIILIEKTYEKLSNKIQTHELAASGKQIDIKNIENGIYTAPQSIHVNKMQSLQDKIPFLLESIILNKYENKKTIPRKKVKECKNITKFYITMMNQAFQNNKLNAFFVLFQTLNKSSLKKFVTNTDWYEQYQHLFIPDTNEFFKLAEKHNATPSIEFFLRLFEHAQTDMNFNHVTKYLTLGENAAKFQTEKNSVSSNENMASIDIGDFADTYLFNCNALVCEASYLTLSIKINNKKFQEYVNQRSNEILPLFKPEKKSLADFKNISELYHHLSTSHYREWGYHLSDEEPQKKIIAFILDKISYSVDQNHTIPNIQEIFSVLKIVNEIEISLGNKSKEPYGLYKNIFDRYYDVLEENKNTLKPETLNDFESTLMRSKDFLDIVNASPQWFEFFKEKTACHKSAINLEEKLYDLIHHIEPEPIDEEDSSFIGLLNSILEDAPLSIFGEQNKNMPNANFSAIMSAREYWITPYDPEYVEPSQIFLSLSQSHQSTLSKFSDESLQNQFVSALPWSKTLSEIQSVSSITPEKNPNLLNTEIPLEHETQLSVIKYLLISFDLMGKLCGRDGVLALKNYDIIDKLINKIEKLQSDLSGEYCKRKDFKNMLSEQIDAIQKQNGQLYLSSKQNSQGFFIINESMNNFCHLNEQIAHQLLNVPFNESVLSPNKPSPPHDALISKATFFASSQKNKSTRPPQLKVAAQSEPEILIKNSRSPK